MARKVQELRIDDVIFKPSLKVGNSTEVKPVEKLNSVSIDHAKQIVFKQMENEGLRPKTLLAYNQTFTKYVEFLNIKEIDDIDKEGFMQWLDSLNYLDKTTKANRFRFMSAILTRFYDNGWLKEQGKFWRDIKIKSEKKVKKAADEKELEILLSVIDTTTYIGWRDVTVLLLLYRTGIRIHTLTCLKEEHINFNEKMLVLSGDIQKNGRPLMMPLDDELLMLLKRLMKQNHEIRKRYKENNDYIFITKSGKPTFNNYSHNNAISKRINAYSKKYGLSISPHKIRRLFATNLVRKKAPLAIISKALGHSSYEVTQRYIDMDINEVADRLRDYL